MTTARYLRPTLRFLLVAGSAFAAFVTTAASPRVACAQAQGGDARALFEQGMAALQSNRPADAARAFEQSYRLRPVPVVQYNLGLALRALGRNREAAESFERFLRDPPANVEAQRLAAVRSEMEGLRASLARVQLSLDPRDAAVFVDGRAVALEAGALTLDPGHHVVEFRADGRLPQRREQDFANGSSLRWNVTLASQATPAPTAPALAAGPERAPDDGRDLQRVGIAPPSGTTSAPTAQPGGGRGWVIPVVVVGALLVAGGVAAGVWALTQDGTVRPPETTTGWTVETITVRGGGARW